MEKIIDVTKYKKITPELLTKLMQDSWIETNREMPEILLMTEQQKKDFDKHITKISKKVIKAREEHPTSFGTLTIKIK